MLNNIVSHMSELTQNAFMDCLLKEGEDTTNCVRIEGISDVFDLHSQRLEKKRNLVTTLLAELPAEFKEGSSFLNLCITKDGKLWTSPYMPCMFEQCEQLAVMAIGLGLMEYCSLKKLWVFLPGGVPYLIIK